MTDKMQMVDEFALASDSSYSTIIVMDTVTGSDTIRIVLVRWLIITATYSHDKPNKETHLVNRLVISHASVLHAGHRCSIHFSVANRKVVVSCGWYNGERRGLLDFCDRCHRRPLLTPFLHLLNAFK